MVTYESISKKLGFDLDEFMEKEHQRSMKIEYLYEDDSEPLDSPIITLLNQEEQDFVIDRRLKQLGLL